MKKEELDRKVKLWLGEREEYRHKIQGGGMIWNWGGWREWRIWVRLKEGRGVRG